MPKVLCAICGETAPCPWGHMQVVDISGANLNWINSGHLKMPPQETMALLNELIGMESAATNMEANDAYFGYRPYPLGKLGGLLNAVMEDWAFDVPPKFLEVGCGPGTKMLFAMRAFGMEAHGFDIDPSLAMDAHNFLDARGEAYDTEGEPRVWRDDAEDFAGYNDYDIVFVNRPLRDYDRELQLENHIAGSMRMNSYLILGNALITPPGWKYLAMDVVARAYRKVCRCYEAETFLAVDGGEAFVRVDCKLCNRRIAIY